MKRDKNTDYTITDPEERREMERAADGLAHVLRVGLLIGVGMVAVGVFLLLSACHKESADTAGGTAMVTVSTSLMDVSMDAIGGGQDDLSGDEGSGAAMGSPAKEAVADYNDIKAMTLAFFDAQGNEIYNTTQLRADNTTYTTFGEFGAELPMGTYTMIALGYGSEQPITLSSATEAVFTADRVRETFVATQTVEVTSTNPLSLSAELSRVVSKALVRSTDTRTAGVDSVRVTFAAGGRGMNPQTGLAVSNTGLVNTVGTTTAVGAASNTISYLFLASDQQSMTVTVEALRTDGTVYSSRTVANVPLRRNRVTVLRGPLYSNASGAGFTVSTAWGGDTTFVDF